MAELPYDVPLPARILTGARAFAGRGFQWWHEHVDELSVAIGPNHVPMRENRRD